MLPLLIPEGPMNIDIALLIPTAVLALIILYYYVRAMKRRPPWWAESVNKRNAWPSRGSVYACHCPKLPRAGSTITKVGTTQRTTITERMKEIARTMTGQPVKLRFAIDYMPFAWSVEQEAHRLLWKKHIEFPKGDPLGTEWFSSCDEEEVQEIVDAIIQAAKAVRFYAVSNNCWPDWAKPMMIDMRGGKIVKAPIFTKGNSPGLKISA
jgi:hypothetical protein